uniref:protein jagged-1-like isoform X1 n=2 Tax=Myxine glutinosa TaxID=7769 RepID=UPI00358E1B20
MLAAGILVLVFSESCLASGVLEIQIVSFHNPEGLTARGECCDPMDEPNDRPCPPSDPCDTFFRVCLREYQPRFPGISPRSSPTACPLGAVSTPILGGNSFYPGERGLIIVPFRYAWPSAFTLILEARDHDNHSSSSDPLVARLAEAVLLRPGQVWRRLLLPLGLSGRLEAVARVRCDIHYHGPACKRLCRPRNDYFGHYGCDSDGRRVCLRGWSGQGCDQPVCKLGCDAVHGYCTKPSECKCKYGWRGPRCDACHPYPGCQHGSCTRPWECHCHKNWGGLLCDKDLNPCAREPCEHRGECRHTEPGHYLCICLSGWHGKNCQIRDHNVSAAPIHMDADKMEHIYTASAQSDPRRPLLGALTQLQVQLPQRTFGKDYPLLTSSLVIALAVLVLLAVSVGLAWRCRQTRSSKQLEVSLRPRSSDINNLEQCWEAQVCRRNGLVELTESTRACPLV